MIIIALAYFAIANNQRCKTMKRGGARRNAGRKKGSVAKHKKNAWYNARMSSGLREMLSRAADRGSRSLAREIELRLEKSFEDSIAQEWGGSQNFALARLMGTIAQFVNGTVAAPWRENRFAFECLREAMHETLRYLSHYVPRETQAAPADIQQRTSPDDQALWLDPIQAGRFIAVAVWRQFGEKKPGITEPVHDVFRLLANIGQDLDLPGGFDDANELHATVRRERNPS
jgi:hypothetical protein